MAHVVHQHSHIEDTPINAAFWIAGACLAVIAVAALFVVYGGNNTFMVADPAFPMPPMFPLIPLL